MKRSFIDLVAVPVTGLLVALLTGCFSLAGFGVGAALDATGPDSTVLIGDALMGLPPGSDATLIGRDGVERAAHIIQPALEPLDAYRKAYAAHMSTDSSLPRPGESVKVVIDKRVFPDVELTGYAVGALWLKFEQGRGSVYVRWDRIGAVRSGNGRIWSADDLRRSVEQLRPPTQSGLLIRRVDDSPAGLIDGMSRLTEFVRVSDIAGARVEVGGNNKWWLALTGFAADVVVSVTLSRTPFGTFVSAFHP